MDSQKKKKILAVASSGGHWIQLLRLQTAFKGYDVVYVTVTKDYRTALPDAKKFYTVPDATIWNKIALFLLCIKMFCILFWERPKVVISTGAAPGYFALRFGKLFGAKTIWLDSIANIDVMSHTGILVRKYSDLWLTQWEHLASSSGPVFKGKVFE